MSDHRHAGVVARPADTVPDAPLWLSVSASQYFVEASVIESRQLPAFYHSLLVHDGSMTDRLERQFGGPMSIRVLLKSAQADRYARWVVMRDPTDRCIAIAGVCMALHDFSDELRAAVRYGTQPLGRLLTCHGVTYQSVPQAFLLFTPTTSGRDLLHMRETHQIFGRRTELRVNGEKRGDIIEALPRYDKQDQWGHP